MEAGCSNFGLRNKCISYCTDLQIQTTFVFRWVGGFVEAGCSDFRLRNNGSSLHDRGVLDQKGISNVDGCKQTSHTNNSNSGQPLTVLEFIFAKSTIHQIPVQSNSNCSIKSADQQLNELSVARWMMNVYIFYSKSMAQKMTSFS